MLPATRGESISFGPTFEDGQFSLFACSHWSKPKKMHGHIIELRSDPIIRPLKFIEFFRVYVLWTRNRWIQTNCRTRASFSGPLMFYWCYLLADVSALGSWPFFLFQENLQLALCVELHPRIQAGQALRKENSCQTMNYCAVTRKVPFRGVDEEAGSVSRITHSHAVLMHTRLYADASEVTHGEAKTKSQAEPLLLSERNTCLCSKPCKKLKINIPCSLLQ